MIYFIVYKGGYSLYFLWVKLIDYDKLPNQVKV
jgi:hypothetical protein